MRVRISQSERDVVTSMESRLYLNYGDTVNKGVHDRPHSPVGELWNKNVVSLVSYYYYYYYYYKIIQILQ